MLEDVEMKDWGYWLTHLALLLVVVYSRFDAAVISIAIIVAIFQNLGQSSQNSPFSAYSIFNKGCQYLLGDARPDAIDRQLRGGGAAQDNNIDHSAQPSKDFVTNFPSKFINRACPCGSGKKAKKCCAAPPSKRNNAPQKNNHQNNHANQDFDFTQFEVIDQR
jgi:hypothetical protein